MSHLIFLFLLVFKISGSSVLQYVFYKNISKINVSGIARGIIISHQTNVKISILAESLSSWKWCSPPIPQLPLNLLSSRDVIFIGLLVESWCCIWNLLTLLLPLQSGEYNLMNCSQYTKLGARLYLLQQSHRVSFHFHCGLICIQNIKRRCQSAVSEHCTMSKSVATA